MDVWVAGPTAAQLTPAPSAITNAGEAGSVIRARCLGRAGLSRLEIGLTVDQATAKQFARTARLETAWTWAYPAVLGAVGWDVVVFVIDAVANDSQLLGPLLVATLILAVVTLGSRLALVLLRSRHYPRLAEKDNILVRDVDGEAARLWAELNPAGAIEILIR